jgi:hypothetical protein
LAVALLEKLSLVQSCYEIHFCSLSSYCINQLSGEQARSIMSERVFAQGLG